MSPPGPPLSRRRFLGLGLTAAALPAVASPGLASPVAAPAAPGTAVRPRLRDLGVVIGELPTGAANAITDVPGVRVGHVTLIHGHGPLVVGRGPVRTGVTAVLPRPELPWRRPVFAADLTINGNGELTGLGPVRRAGVLAAPVLLTDTGSVGPQPTTAPSAGPWTRTRPPSTLPSDRTPWWGETWAGFLHDTAGGHLRAGPRGRGPGRGLGRKRWPRAPWAAWYQACAPSSSRRGSATASRRIAVGRGGAGGVQHRGPPRAGELRPAWPQLRVKGVPVGRRLTDRLPRARSAGVGRDPPATRCSWLVATDAPLIPVQLQRLCKRALVGMARTGGISTHGSGDLAIAFSTGNDPARAPGSLQVLHYSHMSRLFAGVVQAAEEAVLNSLTAAGTMVGRDGNTIHGLPLEEFVEVMERYREGGVE